ncbi:cell division protein FtsK [Herbidospora sp. NEAU-GS84]|uniref:Cell division protein FtsK n=1 Tax=Herbidospora solisilvae TaxID=2696284 RepID=A0A7C9NE12_9ACTN|nr:FtsK/SpoIIIE domain-containing protein [Herbidospora solisilvae]NAS22395.1 cell division protein FtsK [Herbidospora solisilvae]
MTAHRRLTRHQMRRHARRMRRAGVEPVMLMTEHASFGSAAIVVICSWLWRYRSELAPIAVAVLAEAIAVLLHINNPESWKTVLAITGMTAWLVALFGYLVGLRRGAERAYAVVWVLCTGGWISAATALGPGSAPLPLLLIVGGTLIALPWWAHRRRRARVRVERTLAAWPEIAQSIGLAGSRIQSAVIDLWGYRARVALARGQTVEDAMAKLPALESALGTRRGAARIQPIPERANRLELRVIETDPHADAIVWPGPAITSITEPIELGVFEDGTPVTVSLNRRHGLVGGVAGAGKSGGVNVIMGNLTACPDVIVWGVDLKRGMELLPWASCLDRIATTPREADELLNDAVAILDGRAEMLAMNGVRVWEPTPEAPALVIVVDEYAELADDAPEAIVSADSIARRGRAVAVTLVAATQRPSQKAMGNSAVRSQMDVRVSFRVRERRDADLILGQGMHKAGWHADRLDAPGKFLISAPEHDTPRRARTYLLDDATVQATAERHAERRPSLDPVSLVALERGPQSTAEPQGRHGRNGNHEGAEETLWAALREAPEQGATLGELIDATGMSRPWLYKRLREHADAGRVIQVARGRWRADPSAD